MSFVLVHAVVSRRNEEAMREFDIFDQGPLGHITKKHTSVWTDLPIALDGVRGHPSDYGNYNLHEKEKKTSSELVRWAPGLRSAIVQGIISRFQVKIPVKVQMTEPVMKTQRIIG